MELQTISQVSKKYGISARMLRYYEKVGLISSIRNNDNAYRFYDEKTIKRLHFIILLRKLRISVNQINAILNNQNASATVEIFERNIRELDEEITSLSTIKSILVRFAEELRTKTGVLLQLDLLKDTTAFSLIDSLSFSKNYIRENMSMEKLSRASEKLSKITDRDVRIIYLPPATVASVHLIGFDPNDKTNYEGFYPEGKTGELQYEFIKNVDLPAIKPDFRLYGFNHPNGSNNSGPADDHGYERWITIPDDLEVKPPFIKKRFEGGLYAAYMIPMGEFEEWGWFLDWAWNNENYIPLLGEVPEGTPDGLMESHLNTYDYFKSGVLDDNKVQLDLLIPIKEKIR